MRQFEDRYHAGRVLADKLQRFRGRDDVTVLGVPPGGVPVAYEVARAIRAPLDVFAVSVVRVPGHEEWVLGSLSSDGNVVLDRDALMRLDAATVDHVVNGERAMLDARARLWRRGMPRFDVSDRTVILVDEGITTKSPLRAAVAALQVHEPKRIIVASPVCSQHGCTEIETEDLEVICAWYPQPFLDIPLYYADYSAVFDDEVTRLLQRAGGDHGSDLSIGAG
jgi:putative phosphoribosyl transferase